MDCGYIPFPTLEECAKAQRATEQVNEEWRQGEAEEFVWSALASAGDEVLQHVYEAARKEAEAAGHPRYGRAHFFAFLRRVREAGAGALVKQIEGQWRERRLREVIEEMSA